MFRKPGNVEAEAMALSIGGQDVGFVGAGEHEGLACESGRGIEALAVKAMALSAISVVHLVEQKFVAQVGAQSLRGGDADIDLIAKKRGSHGVPGRDVDQDLHLGMPVVEARYGRVEALAHQARYDLDGDPA